MPSTPETNGRPTGWSLEIVRGREVGKRLDLHGPAIVLGNAIAGAPGIDLRDQEGASPRRMAGRQAIIESNRSGFLIRDLDSPGGTFVNRRRLLAGQSLEIRPGDEIQVGGVLLRLICEPAEEFRTGREGEIPSEPRIPVRRESRPPEGHLPVRLTEPFVIAGAVVGRTWDDFLTLAANRWTDLRDEMTSGRLEAYLRRIGRPDLLPRSQIGIVDERLDDWLGRLPASRSSAPELDVHPQGLEVPLAVGITRHVLRITNVGDRLLRTSARVEPPGIGWIRVDGRPILTTERSELAMEIDRPESAPEMVHLVLESNGGTRRIPIQFRPAQSPSPVLPESVPSASEWSQRLARMRPRARVGWALMIGLAIQSLVLVSGPGLPALAAIVAPISTAAGLAAGWRRARNLVDTAAAGLASTMAGVLASAVVHAATRSVDAVLGPWAASTIAGLLVWAAIGASAAGLSCMILPFREETTR